MQKVTFGNVVIALKDRPDTYQEITKRRVDTGLRTHLKTINDLRLMVATDSLLRVGGYLSRIQNLTPDRMHQTIMSRRYPFTRLIVFYYHFREGLAGYC